MRRARRRPTSDTTDGDAPPHNTATPASTSTTPPWPHTGHHPQDSTRCLRYPRDASQGVISVAHRRKRDAEAVLARGLAHQRERRGRPPDRLAMSTCGCLLAGPANLLGFGVLHQSLCLKHAESRFCMPTTGVSDMFLVRAQSGGEGSRNDALREVSRNQAAVATTPWSSAPPSYMTGARSFITNEKGSAALTLKWDMRHRLSEP